MLFSDKDPFNAKNWREFLNQYNWLIDNKLSISEVKKAVEKKEADDFENSTEMIRQTIMAGLAQAKPCPYCATRMQLLSVNFSPETQTGDDSKCVWICQNCYHEEFSTRDIKEELKWQAQA